MPIGTKGRGNFPTREPNFTNPAATALTQYGVYALDILRVNANSVDMDTSLDNVVAVDATNVLGARFAVAQEAVPAGSRGKFCDGGFTTCRVLGPCAIGDFLKPVSGQVYLGTVAASTLATNSVAIAQTLEAIATGVTANVNVDFFGGLPRRGGGV